MPDAQVIAITGKRCERLRQVSISKELTPDARLIDITRRHIAAVHHRLTAFELTPDAGIIGIFDRVLTSYGRWGYAWRWKNRNRAGGPVV